MQECAGIFVGSGDGRPEDGLECLDVAPPRLGDELLLRSNLHNLTLNTGALSQSVSAQGCRRTYTGEASCVPASVCLVETPVIKTASTGLVNAQRKVP